MDRARRAVAAFTFCSILVCSGLGFCWKQFAPRAHDCCENSATAPARSCASAGAETPVVSVALPAQTALPASLVPAMALGLPAAVSLSVFALKPPPLVLRI